MKPNSATATRPGASIGITTRLMVCQRVAPRSRAASSHTLSKRDITANITSTPKGSVQDNCAPSAEVYQLGLMPIHWNKQADAEAEHQPGRHQAADHQVEHDRVAEKAAAKRQSRHEARPRA